MSRALAIDPTIQPIQQVSIDPFFERLQEQIQLRAYELYEDRGRVHGYHEEDWINAEREIRERSKLHLAA